MEDWELDTLKENLEEHNNGEEWLEEHTKESVINLYRDLLRVANELSEENAE